MFTYSHANTPLTQSERAHYLSYFVKRIRLWVVPHLPSGIVEQAKFEHPWKSPHMRKARSSGEREKWGTADKAQAFDPSKPTDFGVWSSYYLSKHTKHIQRDSFSHWAVIALVSGKLHVIMFSWMLQPTFLIIVIIICQVSLEAK